MRKLKNRFRILSLALIFCILFASVSCSSDKDKDSYGDLFEAMSQYYQTTDEGSGMPKITVGLVVTVPAGCSADLFDCAQSLAAALSERADTEVKVRYDSDYKASSKEIEILLGKTDRQASADFLKGLRKNDYGYGYEGGKIVLGGHTDIGCADAVKMFMTDLSAGDVDVSNAKAIEKSIVKDSYTIDKITLNKFEISEYAIVYPGENRLGEKKIAERLANEICSLGGYVLSVISDREVSESTRGICIGMTSISSAAVVSKRVSMASTEMGHMEFLAEDAYGLGLACDMLVEMIRNAKADKISEVDIDKSLTFDYDCSDVKLFVVNEAFSEGDLEKYRSAVNTINAEAPSVALFYDCSDEVLENLHNNLGRIDSLGGRVFYRMADGVRCTDGRIDELGESAVYKLTFETDNGGSPLCWVLIGVIEPSECGDADKEEMYASFSAFCTESEQYPTVALFDIPDYLEQRLLEGVDGMEKKEEGYYINPCGSSFLWKDRTDVEITSDMTADVIDSAIYFRR